MGKSSPSMPAPPDPVETANAQAAANKETAITQAQLNMIDQYTPYGSLVYTPVGNTGPTFDQSAYDQAVQAYQSSLQDYNSGGSSFFGNAGGKYGPASKFGSGLFGGSKPSAPDPNDYYVDSGGTPRYQATVTLSPEQQALYDLQTQAQTQYGQIANNQLGQVADTLSNPLDFSTLGDAPTADQSAWDNAYNALIQRNQPQADRRLSQLQTQLANQGIDYGSEAWSKAMDDYSRSQNDFGLAAQNAATGEMMNRYNLGLTQRQQAIDEMLKQRSVPINELAAMLSGSQVQNPSFVGTPQTQVGQTPVADSIYASYNGQMNAYNAQLAQQQAQSKGLFGLLGSGAMAFATMDPFNWSDRRLKTNIRRLGTWLNGLPVYAYRYVWGGPVQIGFMADEVKELMPWAVERIGDYLAVNYREAVKWR